MIVKVDGKEYELKYYCEKLNVWCYRNPCIEYAKLGKRPCSDCDKNLNKGVKK